MTSPVAFVCVALFKVCVCVYLQKNQIHCVSAAMSIPKLLVRLKIPANPPKTKTKNSNLHGFKMMMIAFITIKSSLVPLIEGLCAQIYFRFEISVVCVHIFCFSFSEEKIC